MPVRAVASVPSLPPISGPLTASGVSVGTSYEVTTATEPGGPGLLQLKRVMNFPTSRTIFLADSEYGWTWQNRTTFGGTGTDNTTNATWSTWNFGAPSVDYWSTTRTAPHRYRTVQLSRGDQLEIIVRTRSNAARDFEGSGIMVVSDANQTHWSQFLVAYDAALKVIGYEQSGNVANTSITSGQRDAGIWLRMVFALDGWSGWLSHDSGSTPPSSWTYVCGSVPVTTGTYRVGTFAKKVNGVSGFTPQFGWFSMTLTSSSLHRQAWQWGTELFSTSGPEQLIGEVDFGSSVALDQTKLRQILADAVNTRPHDSATVTFSVVGGASTGPASGTYYAAGSVVVSGSYRFWRLYAKVTSATGVEQGSVRLPISLPTSA